MPHDHKFWDDALRQVQAQVLAEIRSCGLTVTKKSPLYRLYQFCQQRIDAGPPAPAPTNRELAGKYGVSLRTVTNWRREGCPFDQGQVKVLDWLAQRRYVPAGTRENFSRQFTKRNGLRFVFREFKTALDNARQFKRDCLTHGFEPPRWIKGFRATRSTKGISIRRKSKGNRNSVKRAKTRSEAAYFTKFVAAASKVIDGIDADGTT